MATPPHQGRRNHNLRSSSLLELSHDELGVIFDGIADPLEPTVAVALSGTCLGLRTPLRAGLEVLKERRQRAAALCRKLGRTRVSRSCASLRDAEKLDGSNKDLTADDMATLGMILRTNGLPRLRVLYLGGNGFGDAGLQALCEGLGDGAAPSLLLLELGLNSSGPAGAEALAAALGRRAMPKLGVLDLDDNPIGNPGVAALAAPLSKMSTLEMLLLRGCDIGDEGVASLVAGLGKDDFKALDLLYLQNNKITAAGRATLARALDANALPRLHKSCPAALRLTLVTQNVMSVVA